MRGSRLVSRMCLSVCVGSLVLVMSARGAGDGAGREVNPVPDLLRNLDADNVNVAASAARSLGVVFSPGGKTLEPVEPTLKALSLSLQSKKGAVLREQAAVALGRIRNPLVLDNVKTAMDDEDLQVATAAANALGAILPPDEARTYLRERCADKSENARAAACNALVPLAKAEDAPLFVEAIAATNWRVQVNAIRGLQRTVASGARPAPEVYDRVAAQLGNEIRNVSEAACQFLVNIRNDESYRAALAAVDHHGDGSAGDASWRTRSWGLRVFAEMGWPANREALPAVIRQLGDPTANVVNEAKGILYGLLNEKKMSRWDLAPLLLAELEDAESLPLRAAIMAEMQDNEVETAATRAAKVAADSLEKATESQALWPLREQSIRVLGLTGYTAPIETIAGCTADDVSNVRQAAGAALDRMSKLATADQKAKVAVILNGILAKTDDWPKLATAARAIAGYSTPEAIPPLTKFLSHGIANVQDAAAFSLCAMAGAGDAKLAAAVEEAVSAEVKARETAWEYGAKVLGALRNAAAAPLLQVILERGSWHAQANAAEAVAQIAPRQEIKDEALNAALIRCAQSDILQVQESANRALRLLSREK